MVDYDLYDVLAELGYGLNPRTRRQRADAFIYKHEDWLYSLPKQTAATVTAIAAQFAGSGTEALENPHIFQTPDVMKAGGLAALGAAGKPAGELLRETKERMFAA
jgi:type I restriction enzyme R subunit